MPQPYQAGRSVRFCVQPKTQGIARSEPEVVGALGPARGPRAEREQRELVDRGEGAEELDEARASPRRARGRSPRRGRRARRGAPARPRPGRAPDDLGERAQHRPGERGLEVPVGDPGQPVLERDRLALLGQLQPARRVARAPGARIAACVGPPPRPALPPRPWKIVSSIPALAGDLGERLLGAVDRPLRREIAAVLARVGVADHHLEPVARARPPGARSARRRAAARTVVGRRLEVGDRLEQRHDGDAARRSGRATARTSAGLVVAETITVSSARAPWRARAAATASKTLARPLGRLPHLARVKPDVELREVEAEQLDAPLERGEPAVRDPRRRGSPRGCAGSPRGRPSSSSRRVVAVVPEPPPHVRELLAVCSRSLISDPIVRGSRGTRARPARSTPRARPRSRRASGWRRARPRARGRRPGSGRAPTRARARARARSSRRPTDGLPSRSPPIQLPNENGGGAPGTRRR